MWFLTYVLVPLALNVVAGLISGYYVARTFEFRDVRTRACFALRRFALTPEIAEATIMELHMCRDQLLSLGFASVEPTFEELISWAQQHRDDRTAEVPEKRYNFMPRLEQLRPALSELFWIPRKQPNQAMRRTAGPAR